LGLNRFLRGDESIKISPLKTDASADFYSWQIAIGDKLVKLAG